MPFVNLKYYYLNDRWLICNKAADGKVYENEYHLWYIHNRKKGQSGMSYECSDISLEGLKIFVKRLVEVEQDIDFNECPSCKDMSYIPQHKTLCTSCEWVREHDFALQVLRLYSEAEIRLETRTKDTAAIEWLITKGSKRV